MEELRKKIEKLKENIEKKQREDQETSKSFKKALLVVFPGQSTEKFVKNFYFKNGVLFLETESKSFANEVFLKKTGLIREMNQNKKQINEIKVK